MRDLSKLTKLSAALWFTAIVTGCAVTPDDGERGEDTEVAFGSGDGKADGSVICDPSTVTAATYYEQFGYQTFEREDGRKRYRVGLTFDQRARLPDGNETDLDVYFLADGRVIAEYAELVAQGAGSEVINQTLIVSSARVDEADKSITIKGLGKGTPTFTTNSAGECAPGIDFTFAGDLRSPGLIGGTSEIVMGTSSRFVIDPDHLDDVPSEVARRNFQEDVADGTIKIVRF